jgi:hypothetical protein
MATTMDKKMPEEENERTGAWSNLKARTQQRRSRCSHPCRAMVTDGEFQQHMRIALRNSLSD